MLEKSNQLTKEKALELQSSSDPKKFYYSFMEPSKYSALSGARLFKDYEFDSVYTQGSMYLAKEWTALKDCKRSSLVNAVQSALMTGLRLGLPHQECWIIPRNGEACFQFGYQGLQKIASSLKNVRCMDCCAVYKGETFHVSRSIGKINFIHEQLPEVVRDDKNLTHVYAWLERTDGVAYLEVFDAAQIAKRKAASPSSRGPWATWLAEQAMKSVLSRLLRKNMAALSGNAALANAVQMDAINEGFLGGNGDVIQNLCPDENGEPVVVSSTIPVEIQQAQAGGFAERVAERVKQRAEKQAETAPRGWEEEETPAPEGLDEELANE